MRRIKSYGIHYEKETWQIKICVSPSFSRCHTSNKSFIRLLIKQTSYKLIASIFYYFVQFLWRFTHWSILSFFICFYPHFLIFVRLFFLLIFASARTFPLLLCSMPRKITWLFRFGILSHRRSVVNEKKMRSGNVNLHTASIFIWLSFHLSQGKWEKKCWAHKIERINIRTQKIHNEPKLRLNFPNDGDVEHRAERSHNFKWKININYVIICFVYPPKKRRKTTLSSTVWER